MDAAASPQPAQPLLSPPRRRIGKWRALSLVGVHVLVGLHIAHWRIAGRTLAPLEFSEAMHTLELGIVTAGFLFMLTTLLATAVFGRFFCAWGCHILALQDLCTWLLGKLGLQPRPVRSRLLLWTPMVVMVYMFIWPTVHRLWRGGEPVALHIAGEGEAWASFVTDEFWRSMPGVGVTIFTLATCGFLIVYALGARGFCSYVCPYGALFALADRIAPGRIRAREGCTSCGLCTANCPSGVRVHEEHQRYGMVVSPACFKDLNCIEVCPYDVLYFGFGRPAVARVQVGETEIREPRGFSLGEDLVAAALMLTSVLVLRGLYDAVPFLLSLALAAMVAVLVVMLGRLVRRPRVRLFGTTLKLDGRLRAPGRVFAAAMIPALAFLVHSGWIQGELFAARRAHARALAGTEPAASLERAAEHLERVEGLGLAFPVRDRRLLSDVYQRQGRALAEGGEPEAAGAHLERALELAPDNVYALYDLAGLSFARDDLQRAEQLLLRAVELRPDYAEALFDLGGLEIEAGQLGRAVEHLQRAVVLRPDLAVAHHNLALALAGQGRFEEALAAARRSRELRPGDADTEALFEALLEAQGWEPAQEQER